VHLVHANLLTQLVKLAKQAGQQIDDLLRLRVLRKLREAHHVSVQKCDVVQAVDHSLVVLDSGEHV